MMFNKMQNSHTVNHCNSHNKHKDLLRTKRVPSRTQNETDIDCSFLQSSYIELNRSHSLEQKL